MSFVWEDYLKIAEELTKGVTEAHYRSAVSRAYYAVFKIAYNESLYLNIKGDIHANLIHSLLNSSDSRKQKIGIELKNLRIQRNIADYEDSVEVSKNQAELCLTKAKYVLKLLNK